MSHDVLLMMAVAGDHGAASERMVREVVAVDGLCWSGADARVEDMAGLAVRGEGALQNVGVVGSMLVGLGAIPLVFSKDIALVFNEVYVTQDVPAPRDLETWLEVGAWTWNWMEPPLGTISFVLLCYQWAREHAGAWSRRSFRQRRRHERLSREYPQYHPLVLRHFCDTLAERQSRSHSSQ